MDFKDVMIGNWINEQGLHLQVGMINSEVLKTAEPIPLSEEWLYKFGFSNKGYEVVNQYEVNTSVMCIGEDDIIKVKFVKEWYGSSSVEPDYYIQFYLDHDSIRTIKYVHQLQNLCYVLCGMELVLK